MMQAITLKKNENKGSQMGQTKNKILKKLLMGQSGCHFSHWSLDQTYFIYWPLCNLTQDQKLSC